jgi:hypothetical protein
MRTGRTGVLACAACAGYLSYPDDDYSLIHTSVLATCLIRAFLAKIVDITPSLIIMLFDLQPHLFRLVYIGPNRRIRPEKCEYWPFSGG